MRESCHEIEERLVAVDARRDDEAVAAHLASCPACAALAAARAGLSATLAARSPAVPRSGFDARVPVLAAERLRRRRRVWLAGAWVAATAAAALVVLAPRVADRAPPPRAAGVEPAAIDPEVDSAAAGLVALEHEYDTPPPSWELRDGPRANWEGVEEPLAAYALLIDP